MISLKLAAVILTLKQKKNQKTILELDWHDHNWHNKVPETLLKSVITDVIGQDGEIKKLRRSCNRFGYTTSKRENIVNVKQNAVSQESKLKTTSCTLKVDIAYHYGMEKQRNVQAEGEPGQAQPRRRTVANLKIDISYHYGTKKQKWIILGNEQVEAEPGQAQPQRRPESNQC